MAGRAILIKSVISVIPLYYMSIFCIPKGVVCKITTMQSRFLWGGSIDNRKIDILAWEIVVKEKDRGGLSAGTILAKTRALLFKWIWN
jgi:hypothetical protein